jgi:hypothetical protein
MRCMQTPQASADGRTVGLDTCRHRTQAWMVDCGPGHVHVHVRAGRRLKDWQKLAPALQKELSGEAEATWKKVQTGTADAGAAVQDILRNRHQLAQSWMAPTIRSREHQQRRAAHRSHEHRSSSSEQSQGWMQRYETAHKLRVLQDHKILCSKTWTWHGVRRSTPRRSCSSHQQRSGGST